VDPASAVRLRALVEPVPTAWATGYVSILLMALPAPTTRAGRQATTSALRARRSAMESRLDAGVNFIATDNTKISEPLCRSPIPNEQTPFDDTVFGLFRVLAQTDSGSVRVFVVDSSDARIGAASVRLTNAATAFLCHARRRRTATRLSPVVRGNYVLEVEKTGFQKTRVTDLSLDVDETNSSA